MSKKLARKETSLAVRSDVARVLHRKAGVLLDISLGGTPQPNAVTLRAAGDIPHDPRLLPFPMPDASVHTAVVTHVLEFLGPEMFFHWFDELHRVMMPNGVVYVSGPYGGDESHGWLSDPQHRTRIIETSFAWLDATTPVYGAHADRGRTSPKPWRVVTLSRVPGTLGTISYNATLQRVEP